MVARCARCGGSRYQDGDEAIVCYLCGQTEYLVTERDQKTRAEIEQVKADLILHPTKRGCPKGTKHRSIAERVARAEREERERNAETLSRQEIAVRLYQRGWTQIEIARIFNVTQTTVSRLIVQELARQRFAEHDNAESFVGTAS